MPGVRPQFSSLSRGECWPDPGMPDPGMPLLPVDAPNGSMLNMKNYFLDWPSIRRDCIVITILIVIAGFFAAPRIIDGLTPVDELTNKYLKRDYKELSCFS